MVHRGVGAERDRVVKPIEFVNQSVAQVLALENDKAHPQDAAIGGKRAEEPGPPGARAGGVCWVVRRGEEAAEKGAMYPDWRGWRD